MVTKLPKVLARLVCLTTADEVGPEHALVELTEATVDRLLSYRKHYETLSQGVENLYAFEVFDSVCRYGDVSVWRRTALTEVTYDVGGWYALDYDGPPPKDMIREERVAAAVVLATDTGVLWSASPKHDNGYFETPELTWTQLEALRHGDLRGFPKAEDAVETETDNAEETDQT